MNFAPLADSTDVLPFSLAKPCHLLAFAAALIRLVAATGALAVAWLADGLEV